MRTQYKTLREITTETNMSDELVDLFIDAVNSNDSVRNLIVENPDIMASGVLDMVMFNTADIIHVIGLLKTPQQ